MKTIRYLLLVVLVFGSKAYADKLLVPAQYITIQSAIDAAVKGDRILIAPGTYNESLIMHSRGIEVIGTGGPDVTTIDATGLGGSVFRILYFEDPKDPDQEPNIDDTIEGVTMTGGTGTLQPPWKTWLGGAVYILNTNPTITNCIVTKNSAETGAGGFWVQNSYSQISNVLFDNNHVTDPIRGGGGLYLWNTTATVTGCTFTNNSSDSGGGLKCKGGDSSIITGCTFQGNISNGSGGAVAVTASTPFFDGCSFENNTAADWGGGASVDFSNGTTFQGCTFSGNSAGISGGGVRIHEGSVVVEDCLFVANSGSYGGGAIVVNGVNSPGVCVVMGTIFQDNDGGNNGGGIHHTNVASSDVYATSFCGNQSIPITGDWNDLGANSMSWSCSILCGGDIDANGVVDVEDLLSLLTEYGSCDGESSCFSDQNEDGIVDVIDLLTLIANWGSCE